MNEADVPLQPGERTPHVLIVGAGVAGLQLGRALDKQGIPYTILEESSEVGGVWRSNYHGYSTQIQRPGYEFPEFPYPAELGVGWSQFASGEQVKQYIEQYTDHFGLRKNIRFNTRLLSAKPLGPTGTGPRYSVQLRVGGGQGTVRVEEYSYLAMATGLSNRPAVPPHYQDLEAYTGTIMVARHFVEPSSVAGKRVLVVGGNKSAWAIAESAAPVAAHTTLLFRRAHWALPYWTLGFVPIFALFARVFAWFLPPFYTVGPLQACLHKLTAPLKYLYEKSLELAVRLTTGHARFVYSGLSLIFIEISGDLLPTTPLILDAFSPAGFAADQIFHKLVREGAIQPIKGDIFQFTQGGVKLLDGRTFDKIDVVILATGYHNDYSWLPADVEQRLGADEDGLYLYRHVLPPRVPGLAFVGSEVYTFNNILTSGLQAEWLARALAGKMVLPSVEDQEADVAALKQYKRSWMPASSKRASTVALHDIYYHDQLVEDMGFNPHTNGWNLLAEGFMPCIAAKYRHIFRASAEEAAGIRAPALARRPKIQHPTSTIDQCSAKVDMFYGGTAAEILIEKGILSNPKELKEAPAVKSSKAMLGPGVVPCAQKACTIEE